MSAVLTCDVEEMSIGIYRVYDITYKTYISSRDVCIYVNIPLMSPSFYVQLNRDGKNRNTTDCQA